MLMVIESALDQAAIAWPVATPNANANANPNSQASVARIAQPTGDTFRFGPDRSAVVVVLGFRPGYDRVVVVASRSFARSRLLATEEAGNAVVVDGECRRIVLEGVRLAELKCGDIKLGICP